MKFLVNSSPCMAIPSCVPKGTQANKGLSEKRSYLWFLTEERHGAGTASSEPEGDGTGEGTSVAMKPCSALGPLQLPSRRAPAGMGCVAPGTLPAPAPSHPPGCQHLSWTIADVLSGSWFATACAWERAQGIPILLRSQVISDRAISGDPRCCF